MESEIIRYEFEFLDGRRERFDVNLDVSAIESLPEISENPPDWTALGFFRCPNCSLDSGRFSHCPVALGIVPLISCCSDIASFDEVRIRVITPVRTVSKQTTAQRGVSSLMGLLIAISGCPRTRFLKPMARFHLPFANHEETIFRAVSAYLLNQYFSRRQGGSVDMDLDGLKERYRELNIINKAMASRLRAVIKKDSTINALILLDLFAMDIPDAIEDSLDKIRYLFEKSDLIDSVPQSP